MTTILITGLCGFAGSTLALALRERREGLRIVGLDNLSRRGSEQNLERLRALGLDVRVGDVRNAADLRQFGKVDWLIDAAANPSVLAGLPGQSGSRELLDHNLVGTIEMLELCREQSIPFTLLSTSRVYSIAGLLRVPMAETPSGFLPSSSGDGYSPAGLTEIFSTTPPVSLYGNSKLCSESLALEYGAAFEFPVWINRCGVMAGAGQFGKADQGIFSFWIHSWARRRPLRYLGFGGNGQQVRDCLHPEDLASLLLAQYEAGQGWDKPRILHVAGGQASSMSLASLSEWCSNRFGHHQVIKDGTPRPFDLPWVVLDCALAHEAWDWRPVLVVDDILEEIACHAEAHPDWLDSCG